MIKPFFGYFKKMETGLESIGKTVLVSIFLNGLKSFFLAKNMTELMFEVET